MGRFEFREDIVLADSAVEAWGESLDDLFETSARALCRLMADPDSLETTLRERIELEAEALDLLLVDFLSELIFRKDRDRALFPRLRVTVDSAGPCRLTAELEGGRVDPERTRRGIDVKAVTLHGLAVERIAGEWHARFVVDL